MSAGCTHETRWTYSTRLLRTQLNIIYHFDFDEVRMIACFLVDRCFPDQDGQGRQRHVHIKWVPDSKIYPECLCESVSRFCNIQRRMNSPLTAAFPPTCNFSGPFGFQNAAQSSSRLFHSSASPFKVSPGRRIRVCLTWQNFR